MLTRSSSVRFVPVGHPRERGDASIGWVTANQFRNVFVILNTKIVKYESMQRYYCAFITKLVECMNVTFGGFASVVLYSFFSVFYEFCENFGTSLL